MTKLEEYKSLLMESLYARAGGDDYSEDKICDMLDAIWFELTPDEHNAATAYCAELAAKHLDADGRVVTPLPEVDP